VHDSASRPLGPNWALADAQVHCSLKRASCRCRIASASEMQRAHLRGYSSTVHCAGRQQLTPTAAIGRPRVKSDTPHLERRITRFESTAVRPPLPSSMAFELCVQFLKELPPRWARAPPLTYHRLRPAVLAFRDLAACVAHPPAFFCGDSGHTATRAAGLWSPRTSRSYARMRCISRPRSVTATSRSRPCEASLAFCRRGGPTRRTARAGGGLWTAPSGAHGRS
jgi:hypothetical protein